MTKLIYINSLYFLNSSIAFRISSRAKPVLGAVGSLAATGLSAGVPAILKHIASRNRNKAPPTSSVSESMSIPEDVKYREILNNIMNNNVTGAGLKLF